MGLSCATLRDAVLSNPRRKPTTDPPEPKLDQRAAQNSESRQETLRTLSFEEGFKLGIKVRTLENLLKALDDDEPQPADPPALAPIPEGFGTDILKEEWCGISQG